MDFLMPVVKEEVHRDKRGDGLKEKKYFMLFPSVEGISQDWLENVIPKTLHSKNSNIKRSPIKQPDGSAFRTFTCTGSLRDTYSYMVQNVIALARGNRVIIPDHNEVVHAIEDFARGKFDIVTGGFKYYLYVTHEFENCKRVFPIVANKEYCWNISELWEQLVAEDELGVLWKNGSDIKQFHLPTLPTPTVITYLSNIRMCPCCKVVSDITCPPEKPWVDPRWDILRAKYLTKGRS